MVTTFLGAPAPGVNALSRPNPQPRALPAPCSALCQRGAAHA